MPVASLSEAFRVIQSECYTLIKQRDQWNEERTKLLSKISSLETENAHVTSTNRLLQKRIAMLEFALKQERLSTVKGENTISESYLGTFTKLERTQSAPQKSNNRTGQVDQSSTQEVPNLSEEEKLKISKLTEGSVNSTIDPSVHASISSFFSGESKNTSEPQISQSPSRRTFSDSSVKLQHVEQESKPKFPSNPPETQAVNESLQSAISWQQIFTARPHFDGIRSIQFHPDLPVLLTASDDRTMKLLNFSNLNSKKVQMNDICTYYGHSGAVLKVVIDRKSKTFFSAGLDSRVMQWAFPSLSNPAKADGAPTYGKATSFRKQVFYGHSDAVWDLDIHDSRELAFSASADGTVQVWNYENNSSDGDALYKIIHPSGDLKRIPTSVSLVKSNSGLLSVAYNTSSVLIVDIETGKVVNSFLVDEPVNRNAQINQIVSHPMLPLVFTAHEDKFIRYWDLASKECVHVMIGHMDSVSSIDVDPTGMHLVSGGHDSSLRIWDISSRTCVQELMANRKKFDESIQAVAYHPSMNLLATSGADSCIGLLQTKPVN